MKNIFLYCLLAPFLQLQDNLPVLTLKNKTEKFSIVSGEKKKITITFHNSGKKSLVLYNVSSTCICTVSDFSKKEIKPNENGFFTVSFDSKNKPIGVNTQPIVIESNSKKKFTKLNLQIHILKK
jgi:Protein of unknown function (DUF1573)